MMKNEPAFPVVRVEGEQYPGMTLRDYFAVKALSGMLAHSRNGHGYRPTDQSKHWHDAISEEAYQLADAMLAERGKPSGASI